MAWFSYDRYFEAILARLVRIESKLDALTRQEEDMALDLTGLTAEVGRNRDVTQSVVQLVQNLAAQIAAIPPSSDPDTQIALDALKSTLTENDDAIAAEVVKNTKAS